MDLRKEAAYINGQWCEANDTIAVYNPANDQLIGHVPNMGADKATQAVIAAHDAFASWKKMTAQARANILLRWYQLMEEHADGLAQLMTLEQGKPLPEAKGEVHYAASFIQWFAEEGKRIYGDVIPSPAVDKRILVLKEPIGVCTAITPWNFPLAMITRKAAPALAAGCTFVIRPANETPFSALALAVLAEKAGMPAGVFNVITGSSRAIGEVLTQHPLVRKFSFTGSTEVGRQLMAQCATTIKKVSLELGGNAPFIVLNDADMDAAIAGAMAAKFRNGGQTCVCANRFFVQEEIYPEFVAKLTEKVKALKVGEGTAPGIDIGPLINRAAIEKMQSLLQDATTKGAKVITGGKALQGQFFAPTVIVDITPEMTIFREEIFGPIAQIISFKDDAQAIALANDTIYGLAAYFYSRDISRIWQMAEALEYGIVGINTGLISHEMAPFGGVKQSGLGREGSKYGIEDYVETKYLCLALS